MPNYSIYIKIYSRIYWVYIEFLDFENYYKFEAMAEVQKKEQEHQSDSDDGSYDPEETVIGAEWKQCDLPEVPVVTGEEDEEVVIKMRSKIYRWRNQWKERGVGELKVLKGKQNGLQRILVRAQKTHKCIVNHFIQKKQILGRLQVMKTSNNALTWAGYDISDQKPEIEKFCAKFTSKEDFQKFKEIFEKACEQNEKILKQKKEELKEPQEKKEP